MKNEKVVYCDELEAVLTRYLNRPRAVTVKMILEESGVGLHWLKALVSRKVSWPDFNRVTALSKALDRLKC